MDKTQLSNERIINEALKADLLSKYDNPNEWTAKYAEPHKLICFAQAISSLDAAASEQVEPKAYCNACQEVGMSNCGNFDECDGPQCVTCHQKLNDKPAQARAVPEDVLNKIIDLACEAKAGWLKSQSDDGADGTMGAAIYHARKAEIRAILIGEKQ